MSITARPTIPSADPPLPTRVLVVDDNRDSADTLALVFASFGCETLATYGGHDALNRASAFHPDVVLLDLDMPEINGYEVANVLRRADRDEPMLLVAVTGADPVNRELGASAAGFDFLKVKPVDGGALHAEVMDGLARLRGGKSDD